MAYPPHLLSSAHSSAQLKDFTTIDLAPLSPTKSTTSTDYTSFRNERVISVQDRHYRKGEKGGKANGARYGATGGVRKSVFGLRRALLVVRAVQAVGAAGLVACLCLLGNMVPWQGYVVRAPACVDVAASAYALYHLARSPEHLTPSSSSAYHFFALVVDAGLIPFYVFTAIIAHAEAGLAATDTSRWTTSVLGGSKTDIFIQSVWLGAIAVGGLHLISFATSIYLCVVFRKIANLPPEMNPLESSNLTARPSSSRSKASLGVISNGNSRPMSALPRPMSFFGTRQNHNRSYSVTNPAAANFGMDNTSRTNLVVSTPLNLSKPLPNSPMDNRKVTPRAETPPPLPEEHPRELRTMPSIISASSVYTNSIKSPAMGSQVPAIPRRSSKRTRSDQLRDNWFVDSNFSHSNQVRGSILAEDDEDVAETNHGFAFWSSRSQQQQYAPVEQDRQGRLEWNDDLTADLGESSADGGTVRVKKTRTQRSIPGFMSPLEMNPPTPRGSGIQLRDEESVLRDLSGNSGAALQNALGLNLDGHEDFETANVPKTHVADHLSYDLGRNKPAWEMPPRPDSGIDRTSPVAGPRRQTQARVMSRSGADIGDHRLGYLDDKDTDFNGVRAGLRGRNVSGKIAEEGLGGY